MSSKKKKIVKKSRSSSTSEGSTAAPSSTSPPTSPSSSLSSSGTTVVDKIKGSSTPSLGRRGSFSSLRLPQLGEGGQGAGDATPPSAPPPSGLFSPRGVGGESAAEAAESDPFGLFSPVPPPPKMLASEEKMTSREKRDSIRREIRKSIRMSRGMSPIDPDKILDVPIE
eukprot:CAMPEP_0170753576 /NCGR_PEP_ID=MMETSP0437-20130122/12564_1 /TAXON_ID=0 /ORGANISM="Sexangularia sp." /LENGTH=168 /DNA_ID=CAMNT_0011092699 /DNA_START=38 /DNA_END=544 /DNA_ORIENTATION=+